MSAKIRDIQGYSFGAADQLLFDANIWLRLYGPQADAKSFQTKIYSGALKRILTVNAVVHLDSSILSEFINRWARLEYQTLPLAKRPADFKTYRSGPLFKPVAAAIASAAQKIAAQCKRVESGFGTIDISVLLNSYAAGNSDFTDLMLTQLCKQLGLKFITHDSDFKTSDLDVLTANQTLLS